MTSYEDHQGDPKSLFQFAATFANSESETVITLKGHKVVGTSYTGSLPCTGLTTWPVADLCANFISSRCIGFVGKKVLEVGCGLGLCGIVAAKAVGSQGLVILTDGDEEVVEIAKQNLKLNDVTHNASALSLRWDDANKRNYLVEICRDTNNSYIGDDSNSSRSNTSHVLNKLIESPYDSNVKYGNRDSSNAIESSTECDQHANAKQHRGCFDIIIGSDCLYGSESARVLDLFQLAANMLRRPNSTDNINTTMCNGTNVNSDCSKGSSTDMLEPSGDGGGWYYPTNHDHSFETDSKYTAANRECDTGSISSTERQQTTPSSSSPRVYEPVFILAYTRRLGGSEVDIDQIFKIARDVGFEYEIAYDSVVDMFGNVTCERTMMWEHCIFIFTWKK